jgi:cytidylate kinase
MTGRKEGPVITLDGPAGSGKSTTAKAVAGRLGFRHLDSGSLYRALTLALLDSGVDEKDWEAMSEAELRALDVSVEPTPTGFDVVVGGRTVTAELRTSDVTSRVARLASLPASRACLLALQRDAGRHGRLVADGRDMGTVVFPDAELKTYLVADLKERARRRLRDEGVVDPTEGDLLLQADSIAERDRHDSEREHSPLRKPEEAHLIDTTRLDFREQVEAIVALAQQLTIP